MSNIDKVLVSAVPVTKHRHGKNLFESDDKKFQEYRARWESQAVNFEVGDFPLFIDIETTNVCNYKCTFCSTVLIPSEKHGFVDEELVYKVIDEGKANGLYGVKFNMRGEPLLHKKLVDFIRYARNAGLVDVYFNTNASRLDEKTSVAIINSGLTRITFSFEGYTKEYYEKVRIKGDFDEVVKNIRRFHELRDSLGSSTPLIRVSGVLLPEWRENLSEYIEFWSPFADEVSTNDYIEEDEVKHVHQELEAEKHWACNQLWQRMAMWWDGTLLACNQDYYGALSLGNIKDITIREAWHSVFHNNLRQRHSEGNAKEIPKCKTCSFRNQQLGKFLADE
jgi:radical SAM protein with 4Fe4S-binding SPASM domain